MGAADRAGQPRRTRRAGRGAAEGARGAPPLAARDAARSLPGIRKQFESAGLSIAAYNYSPDASFTRRRDRSRLRDHPGARRRLHHLVHHAGRGEAHRAVCREAQDERVDAQPLEHERSQRVRHPRKLRRGPQAVAALQDQPRHRPLHRRQLRRGGLSARAPRRHHQPAHQGPEEEPGRQRALGAGRHAHRAGAAAPQEGEVADPRLRRVRASRHGRARWPKCGPASTTRSARWHDRRRRGPRCRP